MTTIAIIAAVVSALIIGFWIGYEIATAPLMEEIE